MGTLNYADSAHQAITFDDRILAHLRHVIVAKLRRGESFTLTWDNAEGGRSSIWMSSGIPIEFDFDEPGPQQLNPDWINRLSETALSGGGLVLVAEPTVAA